jgi:DNA primase large subunit
MDVFGFAQFPYISQALNYVDALDFKLDELFFDRAFAQVRERGKRRVLSTIGEGIKRQVCTDRTDAEKELLSYPIARILVSCINDGYLIKRYALAEAKSSYKALKTLKDSDLKEFAEEFNIVTIIDEHEYVIHFTDYIRHASSIHELEWKLINRKMDHGWVNLSKEKFSRILEEAIRKRIESGLPLDVPPDICAALEEQLKEIREALSVRKSEFSRREFSEIMPECFPPCMVHALSWAQSGMNLSHSMRFALTSFLLNIGMNVEGIIGLFRVSPDFDEERTRYQVMHINGATGTVYKSPSCDTMVTYGNCIGKEPLCERISHPLGYYSRKAWILEHSGPPKDTDKLSSIK